MATSRQACRQVGLHQQALERRTPDHKKLEHWRLPSLLAARSNCSSSRKNDTPGSPALATHYSPLTTHCFPMHLHTTGHGPPLILLHGWAMHGGVFAPLVRELAADFECHLVDLPGHGLSEERDGLALESAVERLLQWLPPAPWLAVRPLVQQRA